MMAFTTIIPKRRNDGTTVGKREMNAILGQLLEQFGGVTVEGEVEGQWIDEDGSVYRDRSLKVVIACERERLQEAENSVRKIGRQLGQKAMYFEVRGYDGVSILRIED